MTEQQMTPPIDPPATPPAPPAPAPEVKAKPKDDGKRWCVYNSTLTQFVGPVVDKKPTAPEAAKLVPKGHKVEVREV